MPNITVGPTRFNHKDLLNQIANPIIIPASLGFVPGDYYLDDTVVLNKPGNYDLKGVKLIGKQGTMIWTRTDDLTISNLTLDSIFPATLPQGKNPRLGVHGIIVNGSRNIFNNLSIQNVHYGIKIWPGAFDLTINNPQFEANIRGENIYFGGDDETKPRGRVKINGGYFRDSNQENTIRGSTPGFSDLVIDGTTIGNSCGKSAVSWRRGHNVTIKNCILMTSGMPQVVSLGEGAWTPTTLDDLRSQCGNITLDNNVYVNGGVDCRAVDTVTVSNSVFQLGQEINSIVSASAGINVTVQNLIRQPLIPNLIFKKPYTFTSGAKINDLGGHKDIPYSN